MWSGCGLCFPDVKICIFFLSTVKLGCFQGPTWFSSWGQYIDVGGNKCIVLAASVLLGLERETSSVKVQSWRNCQKNFSCIVPCDNNITYIMVVFSTTDVCSRELASETGFKNTESPPWICSRIAGWLSLITFTPEHISVCSLSLCSYREHSSPGGWKMVNAVLYIVKRHKV